MPSPPSVSLPLASTAKSHAYCCVCKKPGPKLVVVAAENRTAVFVEENILIPPGNRCCPAHLHDGMFTSDAVKQLQTTENSFVNRTTITDLLQQMRSLCQRSEKQCLDFDDAKNLTDTDYKRRSDVCTHVPCTSVFVESSNARIKRWRYLDRVLPTNQIPNIGDYVRIVCAVSNRFSPPLSSCTSKDEDDAEAAKMLHLSKQVNHLKTFVEENGLQRKTAVWKSALDLDLDSFPRLDDEELRNLTCGTYQLRLSSSYMQEHLDGESDIYFHEEDNTLLRAKIQSRHISSKKYQLWIHYSESTVESWYCTCRAAARVVGMCSHIAAVIWYLSSARYGSDRSFGVRDWCKNILDAADIPASIDESESDSGESLPEG